MKKVIFTIANDAYIHQVDALYESFRKFTNIDEVDFIWVRVERVGEPIRDYGINSSEILNRTLATYSQYSITEAATSIKPRVFRYLFDRKLYDQVIYLDPDIKLYCDANWLFKEFVDFNVVLTPHLLTPYKDEAAPTDLQILKSGSYNLGFLYLQKSPNSKEFINWWTEKTLTDCLETKIDGVFTDQKWCEFATSFIDNSKVYRHPGCNVAYWNIHERRITNNNGKYSVNGEDLIFMHFSGVSSIGEKKLSKHSNRDINYITQDATILYEDYKNELKAFKSKILSKWSYDVKVGYSDTYLNVTMRHALNDIFRSNPWKMLNVNRDDDVVKLICETNGREIPAFIKALLSERKDVAKVYMPDIISGNILPLLEWIKTSGKNELPGIEHLPILVKPHTFIQKLVAIYSKRTDLQLAYPFAFSSVNHFFKFSEWIKNSLSKEYDIKFSVNNIARDSGVSALIKIDNILVIRPDLKSGLALMAPGAAGRLLSWLNSNGGIRNYLTDEERVFIETAIKTSEVTIDWRIKLRCLNLSLASAAKLVFTDDDLVDFDLKEVKNLLKTENIKLLEFIKDWLTTNEYKVKFNYFSYSYASSGLGIAARNMIKLLSEHKVMMNNIPIPSALDLSDSVLNAVDLLTYENNLNKKPNVGDINFYHCNFDVVKRLDLNERCINLIYAAWEIELVTEDIKANINKFDIVFAPSKFVKEIYDKQSNNVHLLSHNIGHYSISKNKRNDSIINFGYFFDVASVVDRKNPYFLIETFEKFNQIYNNSRLILKVNRAKSNSSQFAKLLSRVIDLKFIHLVVDNLNDEEMENLWSSIDVYVSPHRSEGFGLTILEAMQRDIPVIATGYGGICNELPKNAYFGIGYNLEPIAPGNYPYSVDGHWANPLSDSLLSGMKKMLKPDVRKIYKLNAKEFISRRYSNTYVGDQFFKSMLSIKSKFDILNSNPES